MTKIDLITGFLGAGKTTFLKKYIKYLIDIGQKICILEFDYGAINVDMMLLQEFNSLCDLEMVSGGCDYDCHIRRFKTKLISMGMKKYDRVIIEPSGIFDPDELFDVLYEEPLNNWYEIGSIISIVDPASISNLSNDSEYILTTQLSYSKKIILSKTQNYTDNYIRDAISRLEGIMKSNTMILNKDNIITKDFNSFNKEDYLSLMNASYTEQPHTKRNVMENNSYDSIYFLNTNISFNRAKEISNTLLNDLYYGMILRIKGFIKENNIWYEFNMTKTECNKMNLDNGQDVIIVIGENLNQEKINNLFKN